MRSRRSNVLFLLVGLTALSAAALAHHAFSAEFDANLPIDLSGTVVQVDWINPHAWVHLRVDNDDGSSTVWELEAGTPNSLVRRGMTHKILSAGTEVRVRGYQSKDRLCNPNCKASGRDITFPDGKQLFLGSSGTGAPRDGSDPTEPPR